MNMIGPTRCGNLKKYRRIRSNSTMPITFSTLQNPNYPQIRATQRCAALDKPGERPSHEFCDVIKNGRPWFLLEQHEIFDMIRSYVDDSLMISLSSAILRVNSKDGTDADIEEVILHYNMLRSNYINANISIKYKSKFKPGLGHRYVLFPNITIEDMRANPDVNWDFTLLEANPNFVGPFRLNKGKLTYQKHPLAHYSGILLYSPRTSRIADSVAFKYWHNLPFYYPVDWYPAIVVGYAILARTKNVACKNPAAWILKRLPIELVMEIAATAFYQRKVTNATLNIVLRTIFGESWKSYTIYFCLRATHASRNL